MQITQQQKTKYSEFMQDLWGLFKGYCNPEQADEYWTEILQKTTAIAHKHGDDVLVAQTLIGFISGLEKANGR